MRVNVFYLYTLSIYYFIISKRQKKKKKIIQSHFSATKVVKKNSTPTRNITNIINSINVNFQRNVIFIHRHKIMEIKISVFYFFFSFVLVI